MKLTKALSTAKALYTACFMLTALGLVTSLVSDIISKCFCAAALLVLLVYVVLSVAYLQCPKCGQQIRVKPLVKQINCANCGHQFDSEE